MMHASQSAGTGRSTHLFLGLMLLLISGMYGSRAEAQNVTVNPGAGSYVDLRSAFDAINLGTHTGAITVSIVGDTAETAPAVLNASGTGAALYASISITPSGTRSISGAIVAGSPLIDLNGADNVTMDGLNASGNSLTIANTTVSATSGTSTIRFIGGATNNIITNANIQGSGTMSVATNGAVIFFSTDALTANGNDSNIISNNNIGPAGANLPTKAILGNGSTSTTAIGNSNITINNNNIFDYFGAAVTSAGVATNGGCNAWTITNNRFYQTGTRTWTTGALHNAINIANTTATSGAQGFTITGNVVGFASNTQAGTYTLTGSTGTFRGIVFNGITGGTVSNINSNTVASVSLTGVTSSGTSSGAPFMGIYVTNGVAITNGNTIGSQAATGSLTYSTTSASAADAMGFFNFSVDAWTANSNTIGGISASNAGAGAANVYGLRLNTAAAVTTTLSSNTVGGTVANSLQSTSTATGTQVAGIFVSTSIATVSNNTIRNLTAAGGTGTTTAASVVGIDFVSATPINTASQNTIFNLNNSNATAASTVTGIQFTGGTGNVVERNFIYGLTSATNSAAAEINGIRVAGGTTTYRNNMIALGAGITNAIGTGSTTGGINGINEPLGTDNFFHNSVFIDGAPTAGVGPSYAFNSSQTVNTRSFRNNVFYNGRSNSGGATGKNYAIRVGGSAPNPGGLTSNNNILLANGLGGFTGFFNLVDQANLAAWQAATGQDSGSFALDPQFLAPIAAIPDLHIHPTNVTPIEGNGADVGVVGDFDGQTRSGLTPTDIGADAGNFVGADLSAPAITYVAFTNTSLTTNRLLSATLTDVAGVAGGGLAPRIYYRKNAGAYFSQACSLSGGTVNNGTWSCAINNADMGGVVVADIIGYFVIAQDINGNVSSSPPGVVAPNVNTITTPPATPNTYTIVAGLPATVAVGSTEAITSLTNAGGLFEAINAGALTGNVVVNITSDLLAETGLNALNQWAEDGIGGYTLLIRPSGAARSIVGTNAGALIRINGADRLTIDGSTTGGTATGLGGNAGLRELTIQNTNVGTSAVVIAVQSGAAGAQGNTLRNLNVLGQDPTTTLAGVTLGGATPGTAGTDNDGNRIENCTVRRSIYGVYSAGQNAANPNTGTVFTRNDLSATGTDRIRRVGMVVFNDNGAQITENAVGGLDTNESADGVAIGVGAQGVDNVLTTAGGVTNALVSRNRINGVFSQSATGFSAVGIAVAGSPGGTNTVVNNMISGVIAPATAPDLVAGIFVAGVTGSSTRVLFNSVAMAGDRGAVASQDPSYALAISGADPTVEVKNNVLSNSQISAGGANARSYAIGMVTSTFANLDSNRNDFFASGANASFFRSGSLAGGAGVNYANLAAWVAAVSDDANSLEVDPQFASSTDLHVAVASPVVNAGVAIAGVTQDIDGDPRIAPAPEIGADELVDPNTPPGITPTAGGIARTQGSAASNSQIAVVSDTETAAGSLVVTTQGALPTGISVSNIVNTGGAITADVAASCSAATGANLVGLRVTDAGTLFTDANLTVNVAANTAPVLGTYPASNATTGIGTTVTPSAAPSDNGSIVSITAAAPGFAGSFSVNTSTGVVTVTNPGPANVYTVTVTATDDCGQASTATFQLTVSNSNAAPTITPAATLTRQRGTAASNSALAAVTDDTPAQNVVVTAQTVPAGLTVSGIVNTAGAITGNVAASCTATLGNNTVVLRATDPGTLFSDGNLTVDVTANTAVVQGVYPATSMNAGTGTTVTPDAAPTDNGSISTITAAAPGFTGSFSVNTSTGVVTVTNAGPGGVFTVTVTATDNCGTTSTRTFQLSVNALPSIVAASVSPKAGDAASVLTIANVSDNEDPENTLAVTIDGGASATLNGVTVGSIAVDAAGIVTANVLATCSAANASFTLRVTDSGSLFREATLNTLVTANTAPLLSYGTTTLVAGSGVVVGPSAGPTDSGSITSIAVQSAGTYTGGVTVAPSGNVTLTNAAPEGGHTITIRATDNCTATTDAVLLVNVLADAVFANGFEDVTRTPAKMKLSLAEEGVVQTLVLPMFELQELAGAMEIVDVIEFEIGTTRSLLQVRGATGYREMRLLDIDNQGKLSVGAWMEMSGQTVLKLHWSFRTEGGVQQVQTALSAVRD